MHQKLNRGRRRDKRPVKSFFGFLNLTIWVLRFAIWTFVVLVLAGIGTAVYFTLENLKVKVYTKVFRVKITFFEKFLNYKWKTWNFLRFHNKFKQHQNVTKCFLTKDF